MTDEPTMETMVKNLSEFGRVWTEAQQEFCNRIEEAFANMAKSVDDDTKEDRTMNDKTPVPAEEGAVRIRDGKVEVYFKGQWSEYKRVASQLPHSGVCRCMKHDKKED